jgi:amino acid adenylation domain-containing protein
VQERIEIAREYRVHTLEDRVIPDLTFRRYAPEHTDVLERDDPNAFVQTLLDALPAAFVKDTLCGWDVALDTHGRWRVIECNYSGRHLHFKPGFHCSGFFQVPRWDSSSIVSLARFAAERHHLTIDVIPDTVMVDDERAMYARVARALRNRPAAHVEAAEQKHASVLAHIDEQVRRSPEATAIVSDAGSVNYRELWARSNQLARHLHRAGVTAETCVGVCMGRSADLVTALIGILKAGAAYVPLVDRDPPDRIRQMASDARVALVLTDRSTDARIAACGLTTIDLERGWTTIAREPDSDTSAATDTSDTAWPAHPDQLAYAIYTSGSTGRPKAVAIAHAALTNVLCHLRDMLQVTAADRWLAVTPLTFDIAAVELLLPLLTGAQVWMAGHGENGDGRTLRRRLDESGATIMQATPVTWQLLIDAGWIGDPAFRAVTGGEALSPVLATQLAARVAEVWNVYGPTETTIWSSAWLVDDRQPAVSLGEPIARTSLYILGPDGEPRPAGEPGELFIGGLGLARGYLHQPARTAEHFVPDPFATEPGARMYRTGDQVRLAGGREAAAERPAAYPHASRLEYLGRTDHQIKLRGVRIECGEIESRLRELPSIREAAVVARQDTNGQPRLVAFIVRDRGARPGTHDSLQSFLRARLPDVMVPSAFVDLDALPRTPHGKIDRKSLEWTERSPSSRPAPAAIVAPVTRTEERVAAIWTTLLQVEPIGLDDDFLALGGDSLAAIACLNRVNETFAVDLPIMTVFVQTPTVRQMAALIDACQPAHVRTWARTNYAP